MFSAPQTRSPESGTGVYSLFALYRTAMVSSLENQPCAREDNTHELAEIGTGNMGQALVDGNGSPGKSGSGRVGRIDVDTEKQNRPRTGITPPGLRRRKTPSSRTRRTS
jgi:hypothetical protein